MSRFTWTDPRLARRLVQIGTRRERRKVPDYLADGPLLPPRELPVDGGSHSVHCASDRYSVLLEASRGRSAARLDRGPTEAAVEEVRASASGLSDSRLMRADAGDVLEGGELLAGFRFSRATSSSNRADRSLMKVSESS